MSKGWSLDIENMLDKLRLNCLMRSKFHKSSYFLLKARLKYFRIPVIVLSGLSSVFNETKKSVESYATILSCMVEFNSIE